jgi:hypothetical protein
MSRQERSRASKRGSLMRRFVAILVATLTCLCAAGPTVQAAASGGGSNNVVIANTTADGSQLARSGVQTASVGADTVASTNIARADAHDCAGCRSVAAAVQAIFVTGTPTTFTPSNAAAATNANCTSCGSFAFAYQYVVSTAGPVLLSPAGREELAQLRQEFAATASSGLPFDELDTRLQQLAGEFKATIDQELVAAGYPPRGTVREQVSQSP